MTDAPPRGMDCVSSVAATVRRMREVDSVGDGPGTTRRDGSALLWCDEACRLLGVAPTPDPARLRLLTNWERTHHFDLPAALREWYAVPGAVDRGVDPSGNDIVALDRLGEPHPCGGFLDFIEAGYLLLETDSQCCCQWVIKLQLPVPTGMEPLFDLPVNLSAAHDDPPVYLIPPGSPDSPHRVVYAERFSSYVWTQVWDTCIGLAADIPSLYDDDVPARPDLIARLRGRFAELPPTQGWAGNQPCDTVHRFGRDGTRVEIAVRGELFVHVWATAPTPAERHELALLLGIDP